MSLSGAKNSDRLGVLDSNNITMVLTEKQRVDILRFSGVEGGDGGGAHFVATAGSFRDIGINLNTLAVIEIDEIEDTILPTITEIALNLSYGILTIHPSETIEMDTIVDSKFFLSNSTGSKSISLTGAKFKSDDDGVSITVTLTELQRADAVHLSNTPGGDGTAIVLDIDADGLRDRARNPCLNSFGLPVVEHADIILPNITGSRIYLDNGTLIVYFSEYIDVTPRSYVNLSKIILRNISQNDDASIPLTGATIIRDDYTHMEIALTEAQRVTAIEISSQPGGDTTGIVLDVFAGAIRDRAQNFNTNQFGIVVSEYPDTVPPVLTSVKLFFSDGVLQINGTEYIDATPGSKIDLEKLFLSNNSYETGFNLDGSTVTAVDDYRINITLPENKRAMALKRSGTHGGDHHALIFTCLSGSIFDVAQNPSVDNFTFIAEEFDDTVRPKLYNATLNYNDGILSVLVSETVDITPASRVNLSKFFISNISLLKDIPISGSEISGIDLPHFSIELTEDMRAAAVYTSGTPGGDGGANILDVYEFGILDIAENPSLEFLNHELKEIPDTTKPSIISGHINFDNRVLTIKFDEYIDATPGIRVNISEIHLSNITGEQTLNAGDPTYGNTIVTEKDGVYINITIPEPMRIDAIPLSGTPGGDNTAIVLDVGSGAFVDLSETKLLRRQILFCLNSRRVSAKHYWSNITPRHRHT